MQNENADLQRQLAALKPKPPGEILKQDPISSKKEEQRSIKVIEYKDDASNEDRQSSESVVSADTEEKKRLDNLRKQKFSRF